MNYTYKSNELFITITYNLKISANLDDFDSFLKRFVSIRRRRYLPFDVVDVKMARCVAKDETKYHVVPVLAKPSQERGCDIFATYDGQNVRVRICLVKKIFSQNFVSTFCEELLAELNTLFPGPALTLKT